MVANIGPSDVLKLAGSTIGAPIADFRIFGTEGAGAASEVAAAFRPRRLVKKPPILPTLSARRERGGPCR